VESAFTKKLLIY